MIYDLHIVFSPFLTAAMEMVALTISRIYVIDLLKEAKSATMNIFQK